MCNIHRCELLKRKMSIPHYSKGICSGSIFIVLLSFTDSHTPTPTPDDTAIESAVITAPETSDIVGSEEGRGFAKRIVAEILDRSVAKYRGSLVEDDVKTESKEGGGHRTDTTGPKSNYVNFDIAQTVIVSSREAGQEEEEEERAATEEDITAEDRDGSRTPTG